MKFDKIEPGMILYDRHKYRAGNTTVRVLGEWTVRIVSVSREERSAIVSWNGNRETRWTERDLAKLKPWSMYDECAEITQGMLGPVRVRLKRKAPSSDAAKEGGK